MDLDKLINSKINDLNNKINDRINNMVGSYSQSDKAPFGGKVRIDENDDGLYAIKRINGTLVSDYYDEIEYYTDSLAKVYSEDKEAYALMDAKGTLVSDWYADIEDVKDGYALVSNDDDQYALINRQGKLVSDWSDDYDAVDSWRHTDELKAELAAETQAPQVEEPEPAPAPQPQAKAPRAKQSEAPTAAAFMAPFMAAQAAQSAKQTPQPKTNKNGMFNDHIETLINAALADGVLTEKEKQVLFKRAQAEGIDLDEFEMILDARLVELEKAEKAEKAKKDQEKPEKAAPKSNKFGDVRKCPNCGAVIGSFQMTCPECGFEFTNVGVNKYVEQLAKGLEELARRPMESRLPKTVFSEMMGLGERERMLHEQKLPYEEARFIRNYPLPMTKEDCIEALNFILPKFTLAGTTPATRAWRDKYMAILQKLEMEAVTNKKLESVVASYKQRAQVGGGAKFLMWYKSLSRTVRVLIWVALFYIVFFALLGGLISNYM